MYGENEDVFYYITTLNENYPHGEMPEGAEEGIRKGMYRLRSVEAKKKKAARVSVARLRGPFCGKSKPGAALLADDFGIASDIWSVTSFMELRRDGPRRRPLEHAATRRRRPSALMSRSVSTKAGGSHHCVNRLHESCSPTRSGPSFPVAIGCWGPTASADPTTGEKLRSFFEVDRFHVVVRPR